MIARMMMTKTMIYLNECIILSHVESAAAAPKRNNSYVLFRDCDIPLPRILVFSCKARSCLAANCSWLQIFPYLCTILKCIYLLCQFATHSDPSWQLGQEMWSGPANQPTTTEDIDQPRSQPLRSEHHQNRGRKMLFSNDHPPSISGSNATTTMSLRALMPYTQILMTDDG